MPTASTWTYVAACLVVPIAWGWAVHVLFERLGARRRSRVAAGTVAASGTSDAATGDADDDDFAPEYQI